MSNRSTKQIDRKKRLDSEWRSFVLIPDSDVPRSGSRTEIVVTPRQCLRVMARITDDGRVEFRVADGSTS